MKSEEVDETARELRLCLDMSGDWLAAEKLIDKLATEVERLRRENEEYAERLLKYITPTAEEFDEYIDNQN